MAYMVIVAHQAELVKSAVAHWLCMRIAQCLATWRDHTSMVDVPSIAIDTAVALWTHAQQAHGLQLWMHVAKQWRQAWKAVAQWSGRLKAQAWRRWLEYCAELLRSRAAIEHSVKMWAHRQLAKCIHKWRAVAESAADTGSSMRRAVANW